MAFLAAIPAFVVTVLYSEKDHHDIGLMQIKEFTRSFRVFFGDRVLRATAFVEMATYFSFGAFETFLPVLLFDRGYAAFEIGIIFAVQVVLMAITKPLFGRVADRVDKRVQIVVGLLLIGCFRCCYSLFLKFCIFPPDKYHCRSRPLSLDSRNRIIRG